MRFGGSVLELQVEVDLTPHDKVEGPVRSRGTPRTTPSWALEEIWGQGLLFSRGKVGSKTWKDNHHGRKCVEKQID